jgi:uncharacterized protein (TIGR03067 family)
MIHRLCTDYLIRGHLPDKMQPARSKSRPRLDKTAIPDEMTVMMKVISLLLIGAVAAICAGCINRQFGGATTRSAAAERDYALLTGTWQLTRAVVDGRLVPQDVVRNTILITDHNTFRFPKASGVGTHPAGTFTVDPIPRPKRVDSIAVGGPHAGQLTLGIYEILDATHKRACWGRPGRPRPAKFTSFPGDDWTLQYWTKIGPVPSR